MPRMPPFGKATRNDEDEALIDRMERDGQAEIEKALDKLRKDLFRGITEGDAHIMARRLDDSAITKPFRETMEKLITEWALAGAASGRRDIEHAVTNA